MVEPVSRFKEWTYTHSMYISTYRVCIYWIEQGQGGKLLAPTDLKVIIQAGSFG
jgi:hypothetical protein